jgi:hypothetical protein
MGGRVCFFFKVLLFWSHLICGGFGIWGFIVELEGRKVCCKSLSLSLAPAPSLPLSWSNLQPRGRRMPGEEGRGRAT